MATFRYSGRTRIRTGARLDDAIRLQSSLGLILPRHKSAVGVHERTTVSLNLVLRLPDNSKSNAVDLSRHANGRSSTIRPARLSHVQPQKRRGPMPQRVERVWIFARATCERHPTFPSVSAQVSRETKSMGSSIILTEPMARREYRDCRDLFSEGAIIAPVCRLDSPPRLVDFRICPLRQSASKLTHFGCLGLCTKLLHCVLNHHSCIDNHVGFMQLHRPHRFAGDIF